MTETGTIQDLPTMLGQALGASPTAAHTTGGLLLSLGVLCAVGLAFSALMGKGRNSHAGMMMTGIVLFVTMGFLYVVTWLDISFLIIACVIVGVMFARAAKEAITG